MVSESLARKFRPAGFEQPDRIELMGYKFGRGKVLINNGNVDDWFGHQSFGVILSNGRIGEHSLWDVWGPSVKLNGERYGSLSRLGPTFGKNECRNNPALKKYLDELSEITKAIKDDESVGRFVDRYGERGEKIKKEIMKILNS